MINNKEYITVAEFADKAGISRQAVYKKLNNQLSKYVKVVDNRKMLNIQALKDIYEMGVDKKVELVEQPIQPNSQPIVNLLKENMELLKEQLAEKDKQIDYLNQRLAENQKLLDQEQQLHLRSQQRVLELENTLSRENTVDTSEGNSSPQTDTKADQRPWWKNLFHIK